jgi:transposase InsO family protein
MTSKPVALLLADLGVTQSHSRPHVSNDNPYSEAQFKTMKYRPAFPARFPSIEAARAHCQESADARRAQPGEQFARPGPHVLPAAERVQVALADRDPAHYVRPALQVEAEHRAPVVPYHSDVAQP